MVAFGVVDVRCLCLLLPGSSGLVFADDRSVCEFVVDLLLFRGIYVFLLRLLCLWFALGCIAWADLWVGDSCLWVGA